MGVCGDVVEEYTGVALDGESRTDWLARPLKSERQCEYAAADVWYLFKSPKADDWEN